jgi:general stress protein 26
MSRSEILELMRLGKYAVEASRRTDGAPQAAVIGVVVTDDLEVFFDTLQSSRKCENLRADPRIALVFWSDERTVQYEGVADEPRGPELASLQELYFATFPDGRERAALPDITYFRVRPSWARYSDFGTDPPRIEEHGADALRGAP